MPDRSQLRLARSFAAALAVCAGMAGAAAAESQQLPVPKVTLYPGDAIGGEVLTVKSFAVQTDFGPVIRAPEALIGKVARRTLIAGKPIPAAYIRDREVIQKGKPVRVVFSTGGLTISSVAIPLQAGGVGDMLSLRNPDSGTIIKGVVEADGTIRVAGP
jgi:flagellar basal body P-ring formation protein FlgA